jgi:large subunit ribosomal protein L9
MQVILKETLTNLGAAGDIVKVKDGYARNYLIPRDLAAPATVGMKRQLEHIRRLTEKKRAAEIKTAEDLKARFDSLDIVIEARVGEKEKLYGSVTSSDIAEALAAEGIEIDRRKIHIEKPIRWVGKHTVHVKLDPKVSADLTLRVVPSADSDVPDTMFSAPVAAAPAEEAPEAEETAETESEEQA